MAEYIKRETVTNHLDACMDTIWKPEIVALKCFVEGIPAADVEPVVRCGSCRHYSPDIAYCGIHSHFVTRNGDFCYPDESSEWKTFSQEDYCSQGERRDDTDEPVRP